MNSVHELVEVEKKKIQNKGTIMREGFLNTFIWKQRSCPIRLGRALDVALGAKFGRKDLICFEKVN